jgi:hypothetical protein
VLKRSSVPMGEEDAAHSDISDSAYDYNDDCCAQHGEN